MSSSFLLWILALAASVANAPAGAGEAAADAPPGPTGAEDPLAPLFERAEQLYVAGEILEAIAIYQRIFLDTEEPVCLANIGRLHEERAEPELAAEYYRRFLLHPRASAAQREQVLARVRRIAPDVPVPEPPPEARTPGPEPAPSPPVAPVAAQGRPRRAVAAGASVGTLGVASAVLGAVMTARASEVFDRIARAEYMTAGERDSAATAAEGRRAAGIGLLVGGGAALIVGVTVAAIGGKRLASGRRGRERPRARLSGLGLAF